MFENGDNVMLYLSAESIVAKKAACDLRGAESSTGHYFTGSKEVEVYESRLVGSKTSWYFCMSLLQSTLEKLLELMKGCGRISVKKNWRRNGVVLDLIEYLILL